MEILLISSMLFFVNCTLFFIHTFKYFIVLDYFVLQLNLVRSFRQKHKHLYSTTNHIPQL